MIFPSQRPKTFLKIQLRDMKAYLLKNNLVSCPVCLSFLLRENNRWCCLRMRAQPEKYPSVQEGSNRKRDKLCVHHPLSERGVEVGYWPEVAISMTTPSWSETVLPILWRGSFRIKYLMCLHCAGNVKVYFAFQCDCCQSPPAATAVLTQTIH